MKLNAKKDHIAECIQITIHNTIKHQGIEIYLFDILIENDS